MSLGPLMIDLRGTAIAADERAWLTSPLVGGVILFTRNFESVAQLTQLVAEIHAVRQPPLLVTVDQEGGRVQRFREPFFRLPPPRALGRLYDEDAPLAERTAAAFGWLLALLQVPEALAAILRSITENPLLLLLLINVVLLILGTFMDMAPLIIITTPIFLPMATDLGMDPVHFGMMLILNLGIGLVTPPVGSVLFVSCAIGNIDIEQSVRTMWPFYLALLVALALVVYVPAISLWLPNVLA